MASALQVAKYILSKKDLMSSMKLQKLVYYSQAWHLVWEEVPLFSEKIEAWRGGPVVRELFTLHQGVFTLKKDFHGLQNIDIGSMTPDETSSIDAVLKAYDSFSGYELSEMTHRESPWKNARKRAQVGPDDNCEEEITPEEIYNYYSSIPA